MTRPADQPPFAQVISLHDAKNNQRAPKIQTGVVIARHRGRCAGDLCRGPIRVGESIQKVDWRWHHVECVPANAIEWSEAA
jgi:hypothetical protein